MHINQVFQLNEFQWTLKSLANQLTPSVILFGNHALLETMDEKVLEQIQNVSQLPGLVGAAMTMPDAHWGYGFPIGGVAAFDAEEGGVVCAGGVGFDISCGVRCLRTNLMLTDLQNPQQLANELFNSVPAGLGQTGQLKLSIRELDKILLQGARWPLQHGYGLAEDLPYIEENGCINGANPQRVSLLAKQRQLNEMGTLGSGNHYLEVQVIAYIYDNVAAQAFGIKEGQIIVSIHCGSRGLGHQIGSDYLILLAKTAQRLGIKLPERELACAPIHSKEGQDYLAAMNAGINCALANRQIITHLTRKVFEKIYPGILVETLFDVSHNTCKREKHTVDGKARWLYVHRKGATRAFGPGHGQLPARYQAVGQPVVIGGSMGTASYLLAGMPSHLNEAFASASHGAGRAMSRRQAAKQWQGQEVIARLAQQNIIIKGHSLRDIAEEAPGAYKDVDNVALVTEKANLAKRVALLKPIICVKG